MERRASWGPWVGLALVLAASGCASKGDGGNAQAQPQPEPEEVCTAGFSELCTHASTSCGFAVAECIPGPPNTLGPCVCGSAALKQVGPAEELLDEIEAGAYDDQGAFYWSEYHFVQFTPYSKIAVANPLDSWGQIVVPSVPGRVSRLRVTEAAIFVDCDEILAFTKTGDPIPTFDPATAFPEVAPGRVTSTDAGLFLADVQIAEQAWAYVETESGVYFIPYASANKVDFVPFDDPSSTDTVVFELDLLFTGVWVKGTDMHLNTVEDRITYKMNYVDLSVIGQ